MSEPKREDGRVEPSEEALDAAFNAYFKTDDPRSTAGMESALSAAYAIDFHAHQQAMQTAQEALKQIAEAHGELATGRIAKNALASINRLGKSLMEGISKEPDKQPVEQAEAMQEMELDRDKWKHLFRVEEKRAQGLEARVRELETDGRILRNVRDQAIKDREEYKARAERLQEIVDDAKIRLDDRQTTT